MISVVKWELSLSERVPKFCDVKNGQIISNHIKSIFQTGRSSWYFMGRPNWEHDEKPSEIKKGLPSFFQWSCPDSVAPVAQVHWLVPGSAICLPGRMRWVCSISGASARRCPAGAEVSKKENGLKRFLGELERSEMKRNEMHETEMNWKEWIEMIELTWRSWNERVEGV